jgi:hypothetical protein
MRIAYIANYASEEHQRRRKISTNLALAAWQKMETIAGTLSCMEHSVTVFSEAGASGSTLQFSRGYESRMAEAGGAEVLYPPPL